MGHLKQQALARNTAINADCPIHSILCLWQIVWVEQLKVQNHPTAAWVCQRSCEVSEESVHQGIYPLGPGEIRKKWINWLARKSDQSDCPSLQQRGLIFGMLREVLDIFHKKQAVLRNLKVHQGGGCWKFAIKPRRGEFESLCWRRITKDTKLPYALGKSNGLCQKIKKIDESVFHSHPITFDWKF